MPDRAPPRTRILPIGRSGVCTIFPSIRLFSKRSGTRIKISRGQVSGHAALRDARWTLVEEPAALAGALRREARNDRIVVIDCATLWLSNLLLQDADVAAATQDLAQSVAGLSGPVIFVSNEVGAGIVPENALARAFRDAQGLLNQALAEACDAVVLLNAGIALCLKPSREPKFRF
ncbi:MAG: bifunctional adenosylcobinamide kinase/adenosylcobinamide-phosphate guanylyltransferase [Methylocella sp.]